MYIKNIKAVVVILFMVTLTSCATKGSYFRLEPSLNKSIAAFGNTQYVPLAKVCDAYRLDCSWDTFIRVATIRKGSNKIILRAGSRTILINGVEKSIERAVVLDAGKAFVPVSFVRDDLWPIIEYVPESRPALEEGAKRFTIRTIMIDPGHGGKDAGAVGRRLHLREDEMNLMLAGKLKNILEDEGVRVIMTRESDVFIPLPKRAQAANRNDVDLFISVHMNASRSKSLRGFECYFLSNAADDNARALSAAENASLKLSQTASIERSRRLDKVLWDMILTENRRESAELAGYICDSIDKSLAIGNRGVRSARFYVLKYTRMPAVLVEAGYLSNRYEETRLKDPKFLDRIAEAVAQGILKYKREYEATDGFTNTLR